MAGKEGVELGGDRVARGKAEWERHTAECPARAGSVYYCECGADPTRGRGVETAAKPTASERIREARATKDKLTEDEYERGHAQARRRAQWELGDPTWAGVILGAFFYPEYDADALKQEQESDA